MVYTVKKLAKLAGVSVRTLHYYDEIGLLKPSSVGGNGYRHYEEEALLKLQQILFYRELELSLDEIKTVMGRPDFDVLTALRSHRKALQGRVERLIRLIQTVDHTIDHLKGKESMNAKGLFEGFSEDEQEKYAQEAEQMYDPETVRASNRKWKAYSPAQKEHILAEGKDDHWRPGEGDAKRSGEHRGAGGDRALAPSHAEFLEPERRAAARPGGPVQR